MKTIRQLFCKHRGSMKSIARDIEPTDKKYWENWNYLYCCSKCGYEEIRTTEVFMPSNEAINLIYEVLPDDLAEQYGKRDLYQQYGSYIYLGFRRELTSIYDNQGKEAATKFIKAQFQL